MPKPRYGALNNKMKALKQRGEVVDFTEPLEGGEEAAAERRGAVGVPCSGGLPWGGGVEEEMSSKERCEVERSSGRPFIGGEGSGGAAGKAVARGNGGGRH
jgi:hypothetical protein